MKFICIIIIFLSFSVKSKIIPSADSTAALKCSEKPGYKIDLKPVFHEKSKVRQPNVDRRPKSLQHSRVQDQNSYGTCYANSASLMLEAHLGYPVSYHQLALIHKVPINTSRGNLFYSKVNPRTGETEDEFVIEGGEACETINAVIESQEPICNRKFVALENLAPDNNSSQELYAELAKIYDKQNLSNEDKEALKIAAQKAKTHTYPNCSNEGKLKENALKSIRQKFREFEEGLRYVCEIQFSDEIRQCYESYSIFFNVEKIPPRNEREPETYKLNISDSLNKKIEDFIDSLKGTKLNETKLRDQFFETMIKPLVHSLNFKSKYLKELTEEPIKYFKDIFSLSSDDQVHLNCYIDKKICKQYEKLKIYEDTIKGNICNENSKLLKVFQKIKSTSGHFFKDPDFIDTILNSLDSKRSPYEFLSHLIGKQCWEKGKPLSKGIKCVSKDFPTRLLKSHRKEKVHIQNEKEHSTRQFRDLIYKQLNSDSPTGLTGNPVAISVCTKFMKIKNFDFNWGKPKMTKRECANSGKHGLHSMTVIGMRCKNGKVQYKVQNSWGKDTTYENTDLEVVEGQGSFWISEKDLVNNVIDYQILRSQELNI